jgi:hypothetical protein
MNILLYRYPEPSDQRGGKPVILGQHLRGCVSWDKGQSFLVAYVHALLLTIGAIAAHGQGNHRNAQIWMDGHFDERGLPGTFPLLYQGTGHLAQETTAAELGVEKKDI